MQARPPREETPRRTSAARERSAGPRDVQRSVERDEGPDRRTPRSGRTIEANRLTVRGELHEAAALAQGLRSRRSGRSRARRRSSSTPRCPTVRRWCSPIRDGSPRSSRTDRERDPVHSTGRHDPHPQRARRRRMGRLLGQRHGTRDTARAPPPRLGSAAGRRAARRAAPPGSGSTSRRPSWRRTVAGGCRFESRVGQGTTFRFTLRCES